MPIRTYVQAALTCVFIIQIMNEIFYSSLILKNTVDRLNLLPIRLDSGHFSLASAIAKAQVGIRHFPYKVVATAHPCVLHGT